MDEIYEQLEVIQNKINIIRYVISHLNIKVNDLSERCNTYNDKMDNISKNDKKKLEKLSACIFEELCNTMNELNLARLKSYDIAEFLLVE